MFPVIRICVRHFEQGLQYTQLYILGRPSSLLIQR